MQSLESCWSYLHHATGRHVIISLGTDAYDILSMEPNGLGEYLIKNSPTQVVGIFSSGTDWNTVATAADVQKAAHKEANSSKKLLSSIQNWTLLNLIRTRRVARYFGFAVRRRNHHDEPK